jgi:hypothetical protein
MLTKPILEGSQGDEAQACLAALFQAIQTDPRDDRENLIQIKGTRVNGTCKWITSNELYKSWLHSNSQLLWLSGGPGKGKTMLSIFLAEELEQIAKHSQDVAFLEYFCDNRDENHNTAIAIIRGLVFQLLRLRPKLFDYILPSFQIQKESLFTASSFETLWRIFETMVHDPVIGTIYCVLDGLDECNEASLEVLLKKFRVLFSPKFSESSACYLNLIVVSRDLPDFIPEVLSSFPRIRLDPDADSEVNSDIHRFIEAKVDELSAYRQYSKPLRLHVKEVFRDRAQGTFLWVGIVATELRKYKATEVEKALDLFPSGLEELYSRMLLQIDIDRRETAAKILRWVVMAVRPLSLSELSAAMEITVRPSFDFSCIEVMRDQVEYCGYILTIKDDKVGLIHQSAKDYLLYKTRNLNPTLEVFRVKEEVGNLEIAKKCLDYLQNGALADGEVDLQRNTLHLQAFPLLSYAVLYWPEHTRSLARSEDIFDLSLPFYRKTSRIRQSWLKTYWAIEEYNDPPDSFTLLCLASYFGILPLAENLLFKKGSVNRAKRLLDLNKKGHLERTALHWAAVRGHEAVVRLLLDKGADIETRDGNGWTALHWAAKWGHEAMVRLLLDKGTDIEARDGSGWTALYGAAIQGHEAVMRLLLEKGADIETRDGSGWTALYVAAILGHEAVVRLLLEKGADIEARDGNGWTALHWAAIRGHEAVVRLLTPRNPNS